MIDSTRQDKAREYARIQRRFYLIDLLVGAVYLVGWLVSGAAKSLAGWLAGITEFPFLQVAGFALALGGFYLVLNLPLSFYTGFILPHRYGLSTQTLKEWLMDQGKAGLVGGILGGLLLEVMYWLLRVDPSTWWVWAAGILAVVSVLLANLAPVLIAPLFYTFTPLADEHQELEQRLVALAKKARTRVQGVFSIDMSRRTVTANAALMGLGNTRRIVLGDTLLQNFTLDEIETVLAHELGHHVLRHIPLLIAVQSLLTFLGMAAAGWLLKLGTGWMGLSGVWDTAGMPILGMALGVYGLITMPLENTFSRMLERQADRYALAATRNPGAFASALARLANQNLADADPEAWVEYLLHSHPSLSKRIRAGQIYAESIIREGSLNEGAAQNKHQSV